MSRGRSAAAFRADVDDWAGRLRVRPREVHIRRMTRKWASCSTAGRLTFSRDLLREDPLFRQAVIVHELLHLRLPNHGKLFRSLMNAYSPGWSSLTQGSLGPNAPGRCTGISRLCPARSDIDLG